jgi:hypothetical protein
VRNVKLDFTITDGINTLTDAIVLPDDHTLTDDEIEAMKMQRLSDWISPPITPAEIPAQE